MCISCFAAYLNPFHPVGKIRFFHHQALVYRLGETRPSATRIKLIGRDKQRFPGRDIYVDAFTLFIPIFILESSFRSVLLCYRILLGGEFRAQCLIIRFLEFLLRYRLVRGFRLLQVRSRGSAYRFPSGQMRHSYRCAVLHQLSYPY